MANTVDKVIEIAKAEVGYLEKKTNSQLDGKTTNAGYNNYTKYARDLDSLSGFYNGRKNGYSWCDVFVDWCFMKAYGVETAKRMLFQPEKSLGASCTYSMGYYKKNNRFSKTPKVGSQIFFGTKSTESYHTGLVYAVDNNYVYTIEGNTSSTSGVVANGGGVFKKSYLRSYSKILGYGEPLFDKEITTSATVSDKTKENTCMVEVKSLKKGNKGSTVKSLQILLKGYNYYSSSIDGDFGTLTYNAVVKFQKAHSLIVDGMVGAQTWKALLD